jgi:glucose/arabinose dehydrogenase
MQKLNLLLLALLLIGCSHADPLDVGRLKLSEGFHISIFSQAPGARFMTFTPGGVLLVSDTNDGMVLALPDPQHSGKASRTVTALQELNAPHGLAFHNGKLYVAETDKVSSYDWNEAQLRASNPRLITNLPRGGAHFTRTILFANGKLYVSVGSDCNICVEKDERRAAVLEMNDDGSAQHIFARGLRNAVGLAFNSRTGTVWAGDNGRDWLGDNLPPEEVNDLGKNGGDFGWPYCYGDRHPNPEFRAAGEKRCPSTIPPKVEMQAHGAPLGIAFYSGSLFPKEYEGDLFVALHGSWNRSALSGFKVVHIKIGPNGEPQGGAEDFITGWVKPGEKKDGPRMGRPVAVLPGPDGALYVSDDTANVVYRVTYGK